MMRPAAAPAPISTGSGTLKRQMMPRATRPMSRVGTSTMATGEHEAGAGDGPGCRRRDAADERLHLGVRYSALVNHPRRSTRSRCM
jgi:hypothetical protein